MKKQFIIFVISILMLVVGCDRSYHEKSGPLTETAKVLQLVYLPNTQRTDLAPGFSSSGKMTFTMINTGHEEIFGVVLRCSKHNKTFTYLNKELYSISQPGDVLELTYYDIYKVNPDTKERILIDTQTVKATKLK